MRDLAMAVHDYTNLPDDKVLLKAAEDWSTFAINNLAGDTVGPALDVAVALVRFCRAMEASQ